MKVLLINTPVAINENFEGQEPLGIAYLGAILLEEGYEVILKDYAVEYYDKEKFSNYVQVEDFDLIGFSCRSASYSSTLQFIKDLNEIDDLRSIIVLGGAHPTALPRMVIEETSADIVVRGEGELTIVELCKNLSKFGFSSQLSKVKGISYKLNGSYNQNPDRELINDLDILPFPARHLLPMERYTFKIDSKSAVNLLSSRGCPFNCIYCQKNIFKRKIRQRSAENIIKEIEHVIDNYRREAIYFVDDHFTFNKIRLERFLEIVEKKKLQIKWRCLSRVDAIKELIVFQRMHKNGCKTIVFGVESGDEATLKKIDKKITLKQSSRAIKLSNMAGIEIKANFMLAFPWDNYRSIYNTLDFAASLPVNNEYAFYYTTPFPGTRIWELAKEQGIVDESSIDWSEFNELNLFFTNNSIAKDDYDRLLLLSYIYVLRKKMKKEIKNLFSLRHYGRALRHTWRIYSGIQKENLIKKILGTFFPNAFKLVNNIVPEIEKEKNMNLFTFLIYLYSFPHKIHRLRKVSIS